MNKSQNLWLVCTHKRKKSQGVREVCREQIFVALLCVLEPLIFAYHSLHLIFFTFENEIQSNQTFLLFLTSFPVEDKKALWNPPGCERCRLRKLMLSAYFSKIITCRGRNPQNCYSWGVRKYHLWNVFGPVNTLQVWRQKADNLATDFFCQTPPLPSQSLSEILLVRLLPRKSWSDGFKVPSKCRRPEERVRMMPISGRTGSPLEAESGGRRVAHTHK